MRTILVGKANHTGIRVSCSGSRWNEAAEVLAQGSMALLICLMPKWTACIWVYV